MDRADSTPYGRYLRLRELRATWPARTEPVHRGLRVVGTQALELSLRLADDVMHDDRPHAFALERLDRVMRTAVAGLDLLVDGLDDAGEPTEVVVTSFSDEVLDRLPHEHRAALRSRLDRAGRGDHGGGHETHAAVVLGLRPLTWCGPEDALFRTVHQITECWLRVALHYVDQSSRDAGAGRLAAASEGLRLAGRAVQQSMSVNDLLELMVSADFHLLRVRLRDGTAADSDAAREIVRSASRLMRLADDGIGAAGLTVAGVLDDPAGHVEHYQLLRSVGSFAKACQTLLCHHYLLVLEMLGVQTRGTLGQRVDRLAERALRPLLPELNEARHQLALIAGMRYGSQSGVLVMADEPPTASVDVPPVAGGRCPEHVVRERLGRYFDALTHRDAERWCALFDPEDGALVDSRATRPYVGYRRLRIFVDGVFELFTEIRAHHRLDSVDDGDAQVTFGVDGTSCFGTAVSFTGTYLFRFGADGTILRAEAEWDSHAAAEQAWPFGTSHWDDPDALGVPADEVVIDLTCEPELVRRAGGAVDQHAV